MKKFVLKVVMYLIMLSFLLLGCGYIIILKPSLVDNFYYRFTTPKSASLVLGTSRTAQGINPEIVIKCLNLKEHSIINHSFTVGTSNYGLNYFREIKNKTKPHSQDGIFILCVDPRALGTKISNIDDDEKLFCEINRFIGNLKSSSVNPNIEYLNKFWNERYSPFLKIFKRSMSYRNQEYLHPNGWLEVTVPMDSISVANRLKYTLMSAKKNMNSTKLSDTRFEYLKEFIDFLLTKGEVYLIRMPISEELSQMERQKFPDFDLKVKKIAKFYNIPYFNFFNKSGTYKTTDGGHLYKEDGMIFTKHICDSIIAYKKKYNVNSRE